MSDTLPFNTGLFIAAFAGLALMILAAAALIYVERQRALLDVRLQRVRGEGPARRSDGSALQTGSIVHWSGRIREFAAKLGERLSVILGGEAQETAADLASAGFRSRDALLIFAFVKTILPGGALIFGTAWVLMHHPIGVPMILPMATVIGVALAVSKAVDLFVSNRRKVRLERIRAGFPDMLELLVISSEAGLGPQPALQRVARELDAFSPELSHEILQMVSELRMTNDRRATYERLNARVPLPEIGVFTQTLDQSDTYGTPFARAMRTLIDEQRANRLMAVEEKAARLPVIMTLPLIFCIMPAVFIVLVGPAGLSIYDNIIAGG